MSQKPTLRFRTLVPALVTLALLFTGTAAMAEDIRTRTLRLVPSKAWTLDKAATYTVAAGDAKADHETTAEFTGHMRDWIAETFGRLDYQTKDQGGDVTVRFSVDVFDPGKAWKRFAIGFGSGNGYVRGTVTLEKKGRVVGRYDYSARLRGGGTKSLAKEVGPTIVLQLHNGDADEELHEYKKKDTDD